MLRCRLSWPVGSIGWFGGASEACVVLLASPVAAAPGVYPAKSLGRAGYIPGISRASFGALPSEDELFGFYAAWPAAVRCLDPGATARRRARRHRTPLD